MKYLTRFLTFILLAVLVAGGGLLMGKHLSNLNKPLTEEEQRTLAEKQAEEEFLKEQKRQEKELQRQKRKADYFASPPSTGPIVRVQKMNVTYEDNQAIAFIEKTDAQEVKNGQKVVLYDKEGYALPLGGIVRYFNNENGKRKVVMQLPEKTNTSYLAPYVGVITFESIASQRLPLSAIDKDKDGKKIIWTTTKDTGGEYTLTSEHIEIQIQNDQFFEIQSSNIDSSHLVITNPDRRIKSDKAYDLFISELDAPTNNPIEQAWIDYENYRTAQLEINIKRALENCANGTSNVRDGDISTPEGGTANTNNSACGPTLSQDDEVYRIFQTLIAPKINNSGGSACGQAAAACGQ